MSIQLIKKFQEFIEQNKTSGFLIAIISAVLIALFSFTEVYETFENRFYDMRFRLKPKINEWDQLVFLDINDNSINNIGKYPWPRQYYATALDVLTEVGARQVTFDMEFPDPSPNQVDMNVLNRLRVKAEKKNRIIAEEMSRIVLNNDNKFAEGIKRFRRVILPYHFQKDIIKYYDLSQEDMDELKKAEDLFTNVASIPVPKEKMNDYSKLTDPEIVDITRPIPILINAGYKFGFTDSDFDSDGVARKKQLIHFFKGRIYFEMALVMLMDICRVNNESVDIKLGESITLKDAINPITYEKKDIAIPIDGKGRMYINWAGRGSYIDAFSHPPFYALLEYPEVKDEVHDFFDEQDMLDSSRKRIQLINELGKDYKEYNSSQDLNQKRISWNKITDIRKKILKIESNYASIVSKEIERIENESKKNKNADDETTLHLFRNYLNGIEIVMAVENLRDKICIAGLVATGTSDLGATPTFNEYPMVGTYHNIVNTVLNESFIIKINKYMNLIIIVVLALLIGILVQQLSARKSLLIIVGALVLVNIMNIGLFSYFNIWVEQLGTNLAVFLPSAVIAGIKLMKEESQKRYIKSAFSRYLAPAVIEKIIESPTALELGGEEQTISIFFSDIAKFSTISEKLTPPELVALLNEYLSEMTDIILSHGGTVDKYIGDAIMAFYGAPLPYGDHAKRCCMAAIDMKKRLRELQDFWRESGRDILKVRMGMNSGKAVVGNMGSNTQMGYTAMGDAVNLASRLEGVNKVYSTYAMISESTYQSVKDDVEVRKLDTVRVVGKEEPIIIYELLGEKGKLPDKMYSMLEKYYKALDAFGDREWKNAISYFQQGLKIVKDDGPSLYYIERCEKYIRRPPSKDWDGVYKLTSK